MTAYPLELNTMPGFAGSSAYYLRYEDPKNDKALVSKEANDYWGNVDLYVGGSEHATGHLIYSRFWNKFLYDLGIIKDDEPFQKMINQGMIQGRSNFVYRLSFWGDFKDEILEKYPILENIFISEKYRNQVKNNYNHFEFQKLINERFGINLDEKYFINIVVQDIHVDVNIVSNDVLDIEAFKKWQPEFANAEFILEDDGKYHCGWAVEKMSKSMYNVVNPDTIVEKYGADTLRLYEMFLGPLEFSKPWDTNGIDGVHRFLKKLWGLVYKDDKLLINNEQPTAEELKTLHKTIKKIAHDIENFSFNTSVSAFMICVNELSAMKCSKREIIEPLAIILAPFAPHISEEIYHLCCSLSEVEGKIGSVCDAKFPDFDEKYLVENSVKYPISFNGKVRFTLELPADMSKEDVEKIALENEQTPKWLEGKEIKKIIVVPKKIVNVVF